MLVTIRTFPGGKDKEHGESPYYDLMIECDKAHKVQYHNAVHLSLFLNDKQVHDITYTEKLRVFFMESGKTVNSIYFK